MARLRRSPLALAALGLLVAGSGACGAGCVARRAGLQGGEAGRVVFEGSGAGERVLAERDLTGRRGYASFVSGVRLREDTPMLTPILEASRAEDAPAPAYGPRGDTGESPGGVTWADPYPVYGYGYGGGYGGGLGGGYPGGGGYVGPGGWVFPGLRPVPPPDATSPFAGPQRAPPSSDVSHHRPGLSTGTGVFGRDGKR